MLVAKIRAYAKEFVAQRCELLDIRDCLKKLDNLEIHDSFEVSTISIKFPRPTKKSSARENRVPIRRSRVIDKSLAM